MKPKMMFKMAVDLAMTVLLFLLMAYLLVGETAHEWLGLAMFLLFILHHILNWRWYRSLFKGNYTPIRILQTLLNILLLASVIGLMVSGIILSREVFDFLPVSGYGIRQNASYAGVLLGISVHEPASGAALEHGDGNGEKSCRYHHLFFGQNVDTADPGSRALRIWDLCVSEKTALRHICF